jgi:hypothetical protein
VPEVKKWVNDHPILVVIGCIVLVVGVYLIAQKTVDPQPKGKYASGDVYFSADDGQSFKAFSPTLVPPFDAEGKTWVRAYVYDCGGKPAAKFLEKYSPEAQKRLAIYSENPQALAEAMEQLSNRGSLIKRPGDGNWIVRNPASAESNAITNVVCPGSTEPAKQVMAP